MDERKRNAGNQALVTQLWLHGSYDASIHPRHLFVLLKVVFHPYCRHDMQTTAASHLDLLLFAHLYTCLTPGLIAFLKPFIHASHLDWLVFAHHLYLLLRNDIVSGGAINTTHSLTLIWVGSFLNTWADWILHTYIPTFHLGWLLFGHPLYLPHIWVDCFFHIFIPATVKCGHYDPVLTAVKDLAVFFCFCSTWPTRRMTTHWKTCWTTDSLFAPETASEELPERDSAAWTSAEYAAKNADCD